jgi:hypothetical protein
MPLALRISEALIPRQANLEYRGGAIPFYTFCVLSFVMLGRSLIHFLKADSGVNSIATIVLFPGDPDPNNVIYMFSSLWGTQQLITVVIYALVIFRYRNLVPLMYALFVLELILRTVVGTLHPLTEEFFVRTPPGKLGNLPLLVISVTMLFLSLRNTLRADRAPDAAP